MFKKLLYSVLGFFLILSCSTQKNLSIEDLKLSNIHTHGFVENRNVLDSTLSVNTYQYIDPTKPLIIIYYPGKDPCNSNGSSTRKSTRYWFNQMEKGIDKIQNSNLFYIYKDSTDLYGRKDGFKKWFKDPQRIIEKNFFKKDPPCSGYLIISEDGEYLSMLTEISKEPLWRDLKYLTN